MDFNSIYQSYYKELYRFACRQHQTGHEAADTLQDVFTALYNLQKAGKPVENPRAWLYTALLNSIRTRYRQNQAHEIKNAEYASLRNVTASSPMEDPEAERRLIVESCLSMLAPEEKNLLLLYHKGFSYREISEILEINYSSVGTTIARATRKLSSILKKQYHELFE